MKLKRSVSQIIFFAIFITLMVLHKAQIWLAVIFSSILLAAFFNRFYCGWICPINTSIRFANKLAKTLGTQEKNIPSFARRKIIRRIILGMFSIALLYTMYTMKTGDKFPLPVFIITLGVLTTILINEKTWHRYLCPWGILFAFTSKFSKRKTKVNVNTCVSCNNCLSVCPAEAITSKQGKVWINYEYCLLCYECSSACPSEVVEIKNIV